MFLLVLWFAAFLSWIGRYNTSSALKAWDNTSFTVTFLQPLLIEALLVPLDKILFWSPFLPQPHLPPVPFLNFLNVPPPPQAQLDLPFTPLLAVSPPHHRSPPQQIENSTISTKLQYGASSNSHYSKTHGSRPYQQDHSPCSPSLRRLEQTPRHLQLRPSR